MLDQFYQKYFNIITKVIGLWCILHSIYWICLFTIENSYSTSGLFYYLPSILIVGISIIGGILFVQNKQQISWSILVIKLAFMICQKIQLIPVYYHWLIEEHREENDLFGLINQFEISPKDELRKVFLEIGLLLITIGILHNSNFIKKYNVKTKTVYLSILIGILLACIQTIIVNVI